MGNNIPPREIKLKVTIGKWEKSAEGYRFMTDDPIPIYLYVNTRNKLRNVLKYIPIDIDRVFSITVCDRFLMKNIPPSLGQKDLDKTLGDLGIDKDSDIQITNYVKWIS